ncbi:MAG: PAS domain S-box protein [Rhodospirillales bacterium]|jgi:PAS domain S-box-containing protein|nr:PAS domain S-box protein [Rhodospirillales bacterium]MBT4006060.1 PAS domain S-box protein [Rhodospirillales bacterium]MBT5075750.1 PAS domain S-box protein [Rhodospirillales bacterium]MBT5112803.1 PAS domain S-box protein [Rhodospirillales bacterium]MBT5673573.1 PAS domain S-box protein [Rhodospirillales bacterium]
MSAVRSDNGQLEHLISLFQDITERKIAEQALQESEERIRRVFEKSGVGIMIRTRRDRSLAINDAALNMLGYSVAEMESTHLRDITLPEDREKHNDERDLLLAGKMDTRQVIKRYIQKSGKIIWLVTDAMAVRDSEGTLIETVNLFQDITASKLAEQESEEKSQLINVTFESMIQGVAVFDKNHDLIAFNPQYCEILGLPADFLSIGMDRREILLKRMELGHFEDEFKEQLVEERLNAPVLKSSVERTLPNGRTFTFNRMPRTGGGYIATVTDTTDQRAAERQLQQAQKMETVGQLTGGIAHDFNNLLAVSIGNIELAEEAAQNGNDVLPYLATVMRASERGAALTNQLLAFSRKQTLFPKIIMAGQLLGGMTRLLHSALGATVEIKVLGNDDLWHCKVDPHQLESAILNLALNARDAMTDGGTLTIEFQNITLDDDMAAPETELKAGEYVMVSVNDTGHGMSKDVLDHVFDPFFTTKEIGKGSGLGLSMVYGFVNQSGGHVNIDSEIGKGTTIKLYLPRCYPPEQPVTAPDKIDLPVANGETILVVEDDDDIRAIAATLLESLNYKILMAPDGNAALSILKTVPRVDLLFTDVILPSGTSGPKIAAEAKKQNPAVKVLYTSGYSQLAALDQIELGENKLIEKPYRKSDLARMVRQVLDQD